MKLRPIFSAARLSLPFATALFALFNLTAQSASAIDLHWDQNSTAPGFGTAGGIWNTTGSSTWGDSIGTAVIVSTNTFNTAAAPEA